MSLIDMNTRVMSMIEAIVPHDDQERMHQRDALDWVASGVEIFRRVKPATPPKHLVSYCVLVDPSTKQALLVDHRDAQLWLPTGGHVDVGEDPAVAASREMNEELGVRPEFHAGVGPMPLMVTVTNTVGLSESHTDVSLWFVFAGSHAAHLAPDPGEFVAIKWWNYGDIRHAPRTRFDPHLPRFVEKLSGLDS